MDRYCIFNNALPDELCNLALAELDKKQLESASVGIEDPVLDTQARMSDVAWTMDGHWLEGILFHSALRANKLSGWKFVMLDAQPGNVQLTRYPTGGYYDWHEDWSPFIDEPRIRKISVTALLNDDFTGGEFEFYLDGKEHAVKLKRGDVLVFPSFVQHRVAPVKTGTRNSAVAWITAKRTL